MSQRVIRVADIATTPATKNKPAKQGMLPVSPATIWRWVRENKFPKPFKLGDSVTVWDAGDVEAFIAQRAAGTFGYAGGCVCRSSNLAQCRHPHLDVRRGSTATHGAQHV